MRKISVVFCLLLLLVSCKESIEEQAERMARENTEKYCPTPFINNTRVDSTVFDKSTRTFYYYCTFNGQLDDTTFFSKQEVKLRELLVKSLKSTTGVQSFKEAGFNFEWVCHSFKNPQLVLLRERITPKDYKQQAH